MKYKPFKAQLFVGDTLAALFARVKKFGRDEAAVLGRPVNSGIDYSGLKREQNCPVLPIHMGSYRENKSITLLIEGHPYWQFFEFGAFEYEGRQLMYCWPSSYSGRQCFVSNDDDLYDAHMGGIETQKRPMEFKEEQLASGGRIYTLKTELPSGERFEVYLESGGKPAGVRRGMVPYDNHSLDKGLIVGAIKGKGWLCSQDKSWIKINGIKYGFGKAVKLLPLIVIGELDVVFGGVMNYDRRAKRSGDTFSITNVANSSKIEYKIIKDNEETEYINTGPLHESRIKSRSVGNAEEIYEITNLFAGQETLSIKFNPSLPDLRYPFKEPYVGRFSLSTGFIKGLVIGTVQAKHLGQFIVFDFLPEKPRVAKQRTMQMSIYFTDNEEYQVRSQIFPS
jgi:hypothetical protein